MRMILADDHPVVLAGLERLFANWAGTEIVARCQTGYEALEATRALRPDLLLLDLKLGDMSGVMVLKHIRDEQLPVRVVLLSAVATAADIESARHLGADGFLYKDLSPDLLVNEVRRAAAGLKPFPEILRRSALSGLTPRELEVARCIAEGLRNKTIAERLGIAEGTVKLHLHNIYDKLGIDSRLELVLAVNDAG